MTEHFAETLSQEIETRKRRNPRYSERAFARSIHVSPGFLKLVLQKKKQLSEERAEEIARLLSWPDEKRERFLASVRSEKLEPGARPSRARELLFPARSGTYLGAGELTRLADGVKIKFDVQTLISRKLDESGSSVTRVATKYDYATGFSYSLAFELVDAGGTFAVTTNGVAGGTGFYVENVFQVEVKFQHPELGPFHATVSFLCTGDGLVTTGRNYTSNTTFRSTSKRVRPTNSSAVSASSSM